MYPLQSAESEGRQGAIQGKRRCHVPCGHISECTDELPPTIREGAIQGKRRCHVPCGHISECTDELPPTIREGAIQGKEKYKNDELS